MPSSVIRRFAYVVIAHSYGSSSRPAAATSIPGVPREVADTFRSAFAKGVYFNTRIRDRYPHREVSHEEHQQGATHS